MSAWFYRFEAKGIQAYVLGSRHLRDVVGASALVEALTSIDGLGLLGYVLRELGHESPGDIVVTSAAGGATLRFPTRDALETFAVRWPLEVDLFAPGLTIAQAWSEGSEGDAALVETLRRRLRAGRSFVPPALPLGSPVTERAPGGTRPAAALGKVSGADTEVQPVDRRVMRMRWADKKLREPLERRLCGDHAGQVKLPRDLDAISGAGLREYLAIIHADGNAVGRRLQKLKLDIAGFRAFAQALQDATREAALAATSEALLAHQHQGVAPGRPVVVGGDDITVVLRADRALPFLARFCQIFEQRTSQAQALGGKLTASAGVAFVRRRHPFRLAYDLAEDLCKWAKDQGKALDAEIPPALVGFRRISASMEAERALDDLSMGPYLVTADAASGGFWPLEGIRAVGHAIGLRDVARGPVRELARILQEDPDRATSRWLRVRDVQRRAQGRSASLWRDRVEAALGALDARLLDDPWVSRGAGRTTPWLDALTVAAVEGGGDQGGDR